MRTSRFWALLMGLALAAPAFAMDVEKAKSAGLLTYLGLCFVGGLLSLLTPCVFPMIPVTISYFVKRSGGEALKGAFSYAFGIISTFAVLGVLAALVFGATGIADFAANPWVNLALGALFVILALNLFGLYEIGLPASWTTKVAKQSSRSGLAGPYFMGMAFSLTSFTCTMPIAAALLASAAKGDWIYPTVGMSAYGLAFALPFFFLALLPSSLNKMPKAGDWLNSVKPTLGFIELAAAVKFFSNADLAWSAGIITRPVFISTWILIFGMMGAYLLGLPEKLKAVAWPRRIFGAAVLALCFWMMNGVNGTALGEVDAFFPPDPYPGLAKKTGSTVAGAETKGAIEAADYKDAIAKAKQAGRPIFVDFTGVTCTNCRWMEKNMFPKPEIVAAFDKMVKVQLYTDRPTDADRANQALQKELAGNNALPTYVLVSPEGKVIEKFEGATRDVAEFLGFLNKAFGS